ncbi:uncharacterized protein [Haliotis cracherodii]|uniref:uncharacterized protein n=1 Tax=Haliotis cracherodii TaxID=6455 RepID=UPI0039EC4D11
MAERSVYTIVLGLFALFGFSHLLSEQVFPDRSKPPGLNDRLKLWWAKEVTPDFHVAGRLSERQIKYASEGGFKSILSLFKYADNEPGDFGGDYLPTTKQSREIAEEQCGMQFEALLSPEEDWCSVDAVKKLAAVLPKLKKPVLLHCDRGYTITFVLLMHLANLTVVDPSFEPRIDSSRFYEITARMGLDFSMDFTKEVVAEITGEPMVKNPTVTNAEPEYWLDYWLGHPVYKNWYTAGQITKSHIEVLEFTGFKSVINVRAGFLLEGKPSQEEVNLLNIPEKTGTYAKGDSKPRQHIERLEETRVDPNKPNSYIGQDSKTNYESSNADEFGDSVGFNVDIEKKAFAKSKLKYFHMPVSSGLYGPFFEKNLKTIVQLGSKGPVLVHCARGTRAAYVAILGAALQHNLSFDWALQRSRDLGFAVTPEKQPEIYQLYEEYLIRNKNRSTKEEL